ncbi:peptidase inhibitor family I36 protein [Aeromonas veronii]|uniref:peptidase inhibitor family I36 protein n=1 Tax=Aeromonas veronii TaxID=654 RepID=UPI003D158B3D
MLIYNSYVTRGFYESVINFFGLFFSYTVFAESAVCLYSEINCGGDEKCIDSMNGAGSKIRLSDFDDRAKSVRVFPGFKIRFYVQADTPGDYF